MTYSKKTKLVAIIMLASLVLSLFTGISIPSGTTVFAEEVDYADVYDFDSETGTINGFSESYLAEHADESLAVVIPATIGAVEVKAIGDYAFYFYENSTNSQPMDYNVTITSVDFSDASNLLSIDTSAFRYTNITSLDFSGATKLESIGDNAFAGTDIAGTLTLPNTITSVGSFAFAGCESLTKVYLGSGDYEISNQMFQECAALEYIVFDDNNQITSIGNDAFRNCTSLKVLSLPEGITSIEVEALTGCNNLEFLYIANVDFDCARIDNSTGDVTSSTFISASADHIICESPDEAETLINSGKLSVNVTPYITYEMTVSFDRLDIDNNRTVLYNYPLNYEKTQATETDSDNIYIWAADESYELPTADEYYGWAFENDATEAIDESALVIDNTLYYIELPSKPGDSIVDGDIDIKLDDYDLTYVDGGVLFGIKKDSSNTYAVALNDGITSAGVEYAEDASDGLTWTAYTDGCTSTAGNYYLTENITTSATINISANVKLALNGCVIDAQSNNISVITVADNVEFSLYGNLNSYTYDSTTEYSGGLITGGKLTASTSAGGISVGSNAIFNMYGGTIANNTGKTYGGGVYVGSGSTFNMYGDSKITANTAATSSYGGGVYVAGTFNMYGGTISENSAVYGGGGVYVASDAIMNMFGDSEISSNKITGTSYGGGGIYSLGAVNIYEGTITYNYGYKYGGGIYVRSGTLTIEGGEISNNTATTYGGGIYVYSTATSANMDGGEISGNTAGSGGGIYLASSSTTELTFEMTDGKIYDNTATGYGSGGGVYTGAITFKITGGEISGNEAYIGGGIYIYSHSTYTTARTVIISGDAKIESNTAGYGGGGIYGSNANIICNITGGVITGNSSPRGGGVYNIGTTYISGSPYIMGNTLVEDSTSNNYLTYKPIYVTGELTNSARIGYTLYTTPTASNMPLSVACGSSYTITEDDFYLFIMDKDADVYDVILSTDNNAIQIVDTTVPVVTDNSTISYSTWNGASKISVTLEDNIGVVDYILEINGEEVASGEDQTSGIVVEYEFETSGSYLYTLTVTDGSENETVLEKTVYIETSIDGFNDLASGLNETSDVADLVAAENYYNALTSTQKMRVALTGNETTTPTIGANAVSQGYYDNMVTLIAANAQAIIDGKTAALEAAIAAATDSPSATSFATVTSLYNSYAAEDESIISGLSTESVADYADILAVSEVASLYATAPTNYTRLSYLVTVYEALSDSAKLIADSYNITIGTEEKTLTAWYNSYVGYKTNIDTFTASVNAISSITVDNYDDVKALVAVYTDADDSEITLTEAEQALLSTAVKTTLESWNAIIVRVDAVDTLIEDIPADDIDSSNVADFVSALIAAENAYDALSADEQALVTGDLAAAQAKYDAYVQDLEDAENYATAVAFQKQVASVIASSPTISDIDTIYAEYVALDSVVSDYIKETTEISDLTEYSTASADVAAVEVTLTNNTDYTTLVAVLADIQTGEIAITDFSYADLGDINTAITGVVDEKQAELLENTYSSEIAEINSSLETLEDFKGLVDALITAGVTAESESISDENIAKIEDAKILYLSLSEDEVALLGDTTVSDGADGYLSYAEYIIDVYAHMVEYVDTTIIYQADISAEDEEERNVVVYGLATKVDVENVQDYATSGGDDTLTIKVVAEETQTAIEESTASEYISEDYEKLVSYEIKLVAYVNDNEPEIVQPTEGESVVVDIPLGSVSDTSSIIIYHVSDDGSVSVMSPTFYISEGITYARVTITSFSEFIVTDVIPTTTTTTTTGGSSSGMGLDQYAPEIQADGSVLTITDANLIAVYVNGEKYEADGDEFVIDLADFGNGTYEIVAWDRYGRTTTQTFTISGEDIEAGDSTSTDVETPTVTESPSATTSPETSESGSFPWWILVALGVVAIGAVGYVVYKKKNQ